MYCQVCGAFNRDDEEYCQRCHQKLLVLSGPVSQEDEASFGESLEESFSFDEHLLERISILEEVVKRNAETVRQLFTTLHKLEKNILINQTGLSTLRELLEQNRLIQHEEWNELWESKMDYQLLALEKREHFMAIKERIAALYHGDKRKSFLQHLEDAEYALFAFDVDRAVRALEAAFRLQRENYELAYFLGEVCFNEGEVERALSYFAQVLEVKPEHYEGLVYSGVIHHERNDNEAAEAFLLRAVQLYPDAFLPHFSLGAVYAGDHDLDNAIPLLERAVELDTVPQALYLLGTCYYEEGRLGTAIRTLEEAVRHNPGFEDAHHLLGLAYLDRRWNRKALAAFRHAQRLNPKKMRYQDLVRYLSGRAGIPLPPVKGDAAEWFQRAEEALDRDKLKQAALHYQRALSLDPHNATLLMSYALLCLHLGRNQEIEVVTRKLLELDLDERLKATAYATLIEALRSQDKYREGILIGEKMLGEAASSFTQTIAYYEVAYNLAEMEDDLDRALDFARRSVELSPEELRQFPLAALGWVHYKRGELEEAIEYLSRASEVAPSATTLTHLGMALLASGQEEPARAVLAEARTLSDRGQGVQEKMMEFMKDSTRVLEQVEERQQKKK